MSKPRVSAPPRSTTQSLSARQLAKVEPLLCPSAVRLPLDYRRYLLKTNGGIPKHVHFARKYNTGEKQLGVLVRFLGISSNLDADNPQRGVAEETLRLRAWIPGDSILIGWVEPDDLLLLYVSGVRSGEVWLRSSLETSGHGSLEQSLHFLAKSFTAFQKLLMTPRQDDPYSPGSIALDDASVRGTKLAKILESLGCQRYDYPGVISSTPRLLPAWTWPDYQNVRDPGGPAFLHLEKNRTLGYAARFDARPAGHPILRISVTKRQRSACIKTLLTALGPGAVLLDEFSITT